MVTLFAKCLKILNSEAAPEQLSLALCFSMVMGFSPLVSLYSLFTLFAVLLIRVNLSTFLVGWGGFSLIAYALDPLFHIIGVAILTAGPLEALFTWMYRISFFRVMAFNNSIVMGSLVVSMLLFIPGFFLFKALIVRYRKDVIGWIEKIRLVKILKTTKLFSIYNSLSS